jgi:Protein kinase domain
VDIYLSCLIGGLIALVAFVLCGAGFHHPGVHHGHQGLGEASLGHHAHFSGHHHVTDHSNAHAAANGGSPSFSIFAWLGWFSPLYLCGTVIGFGVTGTLVGRLFQGWPCFAIAFLGAYFIRIICVRPLISGILMWASRPAKTLGDAVLETGIAGTNFDAQGYGMVRFYLDGQIIQLLGQLVPEESTELRVNAGERLFIRSVDSVRQRCIVSRTAAFSLDPLPDSAQDLDAKPRRVCPTCGHVFSGAMKFCPVCMLRKALGGKSGSGEPAPVSRRLEHYELVTDEHGKPIELGRGAMGVTYKAFDVDLRCPVALKLISERYLGDESARLRFLREARAAASVRHPNVASVFHLGRNGEDYFYAMEFVEGETLERLVKRSGRLQVKLALEIARQVSAGLAAVHKQKLVHRDIKPSNIMVNLEAEGAVTAKIIDLGLAKAVYEASSQVGISAAGAFVGTPEFSSPEQFAGVAVDIRSDMYALGATFWYMLSGKAPFGGTAAELMHQHLHAPLAIEQLGQIPQPVAMLLEVLLEKDPTIRFQSPTQFLNALPTVMGAMDADRPITRKSLETLTALVISRSTENSISSNS